MEVAPFFVNFHHFLSIFTIFYRFSRFTHFCRDLHFVAIYALFPHIYFGQNSLLRNITRFLHVCLYHIQFVWICSHSLPMGKVIVWPTDFFTILSEKWNLSIFLWNHVSNMLTCWGARFHPRHIEPASIFFFQKPFCPIHSILKMNLSNEWQS